MLATVTWLARLAACVLIGMLTFLSTPATGSDLAIELVAFVVALAVMGYWLMTDQREAGTDRRGLATGMAVLAVAAGLSCAAPNGGAFIGFSVIAVLAAGADTGRLAGWLIAAAGVLSIEVSALIFSADAAKVWGYPLLLAVAFIGGRNRRAYAVQAEQSAAMVGQLQQLRAEQRQVAVLDERTRIAREIHDVLAHSLGALGIQLQAVRAVLESNDTDRALGLLEQAQRMATDGLVDTRRAVQALRGDTTRLDEQLSALIESHRSRHRSAVDFQIEGKPAALTPEATVALIRTAQEALVNTAKHAANQPVEVRLSFDDDQVTLAITNTLASSNADATGSTTFSSVNGGYGLIGMRERLLLINGTLTTGSDDRGWAVVAQLPQGPVRQ